MHHKHFLVFFGVLAVILFGSTITLAVKNITLENQLPTLNAKIAGLQSQVIALQETPTPKPTPTPATTGVPILNALYPNFGAPGIMIAISGSGFRLTGNTIKSDFGTFPDIPSRDGKYLGFMIPKPLESGIYYIAVLNNGGISQTLPFIVQSPTANSKNISIKAVKPSFGPVGTKVTITGRGFSKTKNTVNFDYSRIENIKSNGTSLLFVVPQYLVYPCVAGKPCPTNNWQAVTPRDYAVSVTNAKGQRSNLLMFSVTPPKATPR